MMYSAHNELIQPAYPSREIWRLIVGLIAVSILVVLIILPIYGLQAYFSEEGLGALEAGGSLPPHTLMIFLAGFISIFIALKIVLRFLHKRSLMSLMGKSEETLPRFTKTLLFLAVFQLILFFIPVPGSPELEPGKELAKWLVFLLPACLAVLIQTSAEEFLFRGYFQSQLAARFNHPLVWILIPSLVFGMLHYEPTTYGNLAWVIVGWTTLFGIIAADLTAKTGHLAPAIALHFMNNFAVLLVASPKGDFDTLALYTFPFASNDIDKMLMLMPLSLITMVLSWLIVRFANRA